MGYERTRETKRGVVLWERYAGDGDVKWNNTNKISRIVETSGYCNQS